MSIESVLRIRVSLKGRPLKTYRFSQDSVMIGRAPDADVVLENTGVSRHHCRIEKTDLGWVLKDLGSANRTLVNHMPVEEHKLVENDMVGIAKFSLWISFMDDSRESGKSDGASKPVEGTTVLSNDQLERILEGVRESEQSAPSNTPDPVAEPVRSTRPERASTRPTATSSGSGGRLGAGVIGFLLGALLGAAATVTFLP